MLIINGVTSTFRSWAWQVGEILPPYDQHSVQETSIFYPTEMRLAENQAIMVPEICDKNSACSPWISFPDTATQSCATLAIELPIEILWLSNSVEF